jgi:hypothetical protein
VDCSRLTKLQYVLLQVASKRLLTFLVACCCIVHACSVEFGAILLWFFLCDRTNVFWQAEKVRDCLRATLLAEQGLL